MNTNASNQFSSCPLWKRLACIIYDTIILFCLFFLALQLELLLPDAVLPHWLEVTLRRLYLLSVGLIFFGWFWKHGGQTIGMKSWRVKLVYVDAEQMTNSISWRTATIRYLSAIFSWTIIGFGFLWSLFDQNRYTLHDRLSKTKLILIPK